MIDSQQAARRSPTSTRWSRRVRQSRIYNFASLMMIMWGALVFAGYLGTVSAAAICRLWLDRGRTWSAIGGCVCDQRSSIAEVRRAHLRSWNC